jgi:uncharacterized membrane protein
MNIYKLLAVYLSSFIVFLAVDLFWLGVLAKNIYRKYLGNFLAPKPNWPAAIVFYLLFVAGVMIFAIIPALKQGSISKALLYGALFGFFTYMTYELTNYAVIKNWPGSIVLIDIAWGVVLSLIVAITGYFIGTLIKY